MLTGRVGWLVWAVGSLVALVVLGGLMTKPESFEGAPFDRSIFLPGSTTDGHYQIELDCDACHTERFSDRESMQSACTQCHEAELTLADDSHPRTKFTDPRNADRVAILDARWCVTCHQEHRPEITSTMGLSLPTDYCYRCHEKIGEERPTHAGLSFESCSNVGCHNFHDNRALYEDFLVEHRSEPDMKPLARVADRTPQRAPGERRTPLESGDHDAPSSIPDLARWVEEWAGTSHAAGGVNCLDCHAESSTNLASRPGWSDRPPRENCASCHEAEEEGFLSSRHGMRLGSGFSPMTPAHARLPMDQGAFDRELDCNQCHGAHDYDTTFAAAAACLECHVDDHSLAWETSPHGLLFGEEVAGRAEPGSGVSCATCHLPRIPDAKKPGSVRVSHNQNDFQRPRDKMIRASCLACHGLAFSLDSLADSALVETNFRGRSTVRVESIHYATELRWELEGKLPPWNQNQNQKKEE